MKRPMMMMVAGIGTLVSMAARAQSPDVTPPTTPPPLPTTIPDNAEPASPTTPMQTGSVPPLATPEALPPPAPFPAAPPVAPPPYAVEGNRSYPVWMYKVGSAVMLGGGYQDFTQAAPKAATSPGGSWDLRLAAGTRQFIGLEAAYVGGARSVNGLGFAPNTTLLNNGVEGNLRLNIPIVMGPALIEPFGFAGVGWQHFSLSKTVVTADVTRTDDVMTVPYGLGLMMAYGMFMLDARVSFTETFNNNMFVASGSKLNTWGAGGNIGVEF